MLSISRRRREFVCLCVSQTYLDRDCFLREALCWNRHHFQKQTPHNCSTPTMCSQVCWGPGEGLCSKVRVTTQICGITPAPPLRCPSKTKTVCICLQPYPPEQPAQLSLQDVCLCALHKGDVSSGPHSFELMSVPSVRTPGLKPLQ